jgi:hypothetical protein
MKKWIGPCLATFLVMLLVFLSWPLSGSKPRVSPDGEGIEGRLVLTQDKKGDRKEDDSNFVQVLKGFQEILDGWLKSLNERIESEDVTGFEVRFLEILRNILEWVKEKLEAQIESLKDQQRRRERGTFKDTRWRFSPVSGQA